MQLINRITSLRVVLIISVTLYMCLCLILRSTLPVVLPGMDMCHQSYMYLTEDEAFKDKPLTDIRQATSIKYSTVRLVGGRSIFNVGDRIFVTITSRDGFGIQKLKGGDRWEIRIFNEQLQASAAGHVIDYDNGTYTAMVDALWPGKHTITITLTFQRELIRAIYVALHQHKGAAVDFGEFVADSAKETTLCHPKPEGLARFSYTQLCNLTMANSGMSWYCGKPVHRNLLCEDWANVRTIHFPMKIPAVEDALLRFGPQVLRNISITVKGNRNIRTALPPCTDIPARYTWLRDSISGYFYNRTWFPQNCNIPNKFEYHTCLKNKRLILFGDSTIRLWYSYLIDELNCTPVTEDWNVEKWHKPSSCVVKSMNFTLEWIPHAQPFHVGNQWDTKRYTTQSVASRIAGLDSSANVIIVIHLYSHFTSYHMTVLRGRMRSISKGVKEYLNLNKTAKIFIKGPHTHKYIWCIFAHVYREIIFEEFKDLYDKVYYLDQADLTIATANEEVHPPDNTVGASVKRMLSYLCN